MPNPILIASFYKFVALPDYRDLQAPLRQICAEAELRGTILLASEGINATIAGQPKNVRRVLNQLRQDPRFADLDVKLSTHDMIPFGKLKVRLKREIVALKSPEAIGAPDGGVFVDAQDWNALISQADVTLIDARNEYEIALGSFVDAIDPGAQAFHELPAIFEARLDPALHRRIAMYCTGGIRCEKLATLLSRRGYDEIYQLRGGILRYLEKIQPADSLWRGECFVFDERVSLDHELRKGASCICDDCKAEVAEAASACPICGSANIV